MGQLGIQGLKQSDGLSIEMDAEVTTMVYIVVVGWGKEYECLNWTFT